jgi:hypothetical protein
MRFDEFDRRDLSHAHLCRHFDDRTEDDVAQFALLRADENNESTMEAEGQFQPVRSALTCLCAG